MIIYTYCEDSLIFKQIKLSSYFKIGAIFLIMFISASFIAYKIGLNNSIQELSTEERITLINEKDSFSKEKMATMLDDLNVKFPWIPMAQSMIETGHWKSEVFLENNNLFGMREAKSRITTSIGTNLNHAEYNSWRESVYDYAFYQSRYLGSIKTESEYYQYLAASYAEDASYAIMVKEMVESNDLKKLFN
jgi:uncharacterized FlgJ-related protein